MVVRWRRRHLADGQGHPRLGPRHEVPSAAAYGHGHDQGKSFGCAPDSTPGRNVAVLKAGASPRWTSAWAEARRGDRITHSDLYFDSMSRAGASCWPSATRPRARQRHPAVRASTAITWSTPARCSEAGPLRHRPRHLRARGRCGRRTTLPSSSTSSSRHPIYGGEWCWPRTAWPTRAVEMVPVCGLGELTSRASRRCAAARRRVRAGPLGIDRPAVPGAASCSPDAARRPEPAAQIDGESFGRRRFRIQVVRASAPAGPTMAPPERIGLIHRAVPLRGALAGT